MNKKFFALPIQKQEAILNAGFCVFSQNSYKKSPTSEIADAAGISKSLLFHYYGHLKDISGKSCSMIISMLMRSKRIL